MNKLTEVVVSIIIVFVLIAGIGLPIFFSVTPTGVALWNNWFHEVQEADDDTNYKTKKKVEDACRAMITSYESNKIMYEQYKDSPSEEKQNWAEQAKISANKTAAKYNNYILENQYIWKDNIPSDINRELPYIE